MAEQETLKQETLSVRQALLAKLEEQRKSRVITLIHRKEAWPWPEEGEKVRPL